MGKGENAGNQHFLHFPQCFPLFQREKWSILGTLNLSSANVLNLVESKMLFGKGLKKHMFNVYQSPISIYSLNISNKQVGQASTCNLAEKT